jgi:hypothetical protein
MTAGAPFGAHARIKADLFAGRFCLRMGLSLPAPEHHLKEGGPGAREVVAWPRRPAVGGYSHSSCPVTH